MDIWISLSAGPIQAQLLGTERVGFLWRFNKNFQLVLDVEEPVLGILDQSSEATPSVKSWNRCAKRIALGPEKKTRRR